MYVHEYIRMSHDLCVIYDVCIYVCMWISHIYICVCVYVCVYVNESWLMYTSRDSSTHSYVWRDPIMNVMTSAYVTSLVRVCMLQCVAVCYKCVEVCWNVLQCVVVYMSDAYVTSPARIWHNSYVWRDKLIYVAWPIHMCDMTHSYISRLMHMWHVLCVCITLYSHVCHDSHNSCTCPCDVFTWVAWLTCLVRMRHTATHCNTLQLTAAHCNIVQHTAAHCNTLQHTATHCNTLQHTATHMCDMTHTSRAYASWSVRRCAIHESHVGMSICVPWLTRLMYMPYDLSTCVTWLTRLVRTQHTATHCNALQHTATHCNTHVWLYSHVSCVRVTLYSHLWIQVFIWGGYD